MASPLADFANGGLTFALPSSGTTTDPSTGNVTANTAVVSYRVFASETGASLGQNFAGVDIRMSRFDGWLTTPITFSDLVVEGMTGTLAIDSGSTYDVTLVAARGAYGRKGIGQIIEEVMGHQFILDATKQEV